MDEQTITDAPVETGAQALPVETAEQTPAAQDTVAEAPEQAEAGETNDSAPDDKLASFAKGQGIEDISDLTPRERSLLKSAYDNKAEYERNRQKASELEKTIAGRSDEVAEEIAQSTGQDPELLKRLQRVEVKEAVRDFWNTPDDSGAVPDKAYESKMIELVQAKPHLAGDLESLYATAVLKSGKLATVKSEGKKEALQSLAHKQQAAVPAGNATNPGATPREKPFEELSIKEMEARLGFARR